MTCKLIKYKKDILYTVCFLGLVLVDWFRSNTRGDVWAVAVNCGGLLFGLMLLCSFPWKSLRPAAGWGYAAFWLLGSLAGYLWWLKSPGTVYRWQYVTGALNAGWIGLFLLQLIINAIKAVRGGRKKPRRFGLRTVALAAWALMTFSMMFSPSDHLWAAWYFAMFLVFYGMEFTDREQKSLWNGMAGGILLGFFALQIFAYGFRPYDDVRYRGAYINCNMNALFYLVAYAAALFRLHGVRLRELELVRRGEKPGRSAAVKKIFWYLLAGGLLGFTFFTLSRTALLAAAAVTAVYGVVTVLAVYKAGVKGLIRQWLMLCVCFLVSFPGVYLSIRYLPTVLSHPVWLVGEYAESKVHSFDPPDSDKYVSMDEFLEEAFGRINYRGILDKLGSVGRMTVHAEPLVSEEPEQEPLLSQEEWGDSGKVRLAIYRSYWENLNMWGHSPEEGRIRVTQGYYAWHAQNVFLQIAFYYGAPAGLLFTVLTALTGILALKRALRCREAEAVLPLLIWLVFVVFGMLEAVWNPGQLVLFLFFFVQRQHVPPRAEVLERTGA